MTQTHTPGPFNLTKNEDGTQTVWGSFQYDAAIDEQTAAKVAIVQCGFDVGQAESEANARLIAAAPELLKELEGIRAVLVGSGTFGKDNPQIIRIDAAIAKARRQS